MIKLILLILLLQKLQAAFNDSPGEKVALSHLNLKVLKNDFSKLKLTQKIEYTIKDQILKATIERSKDGFNLTFGLIYQEKKKSLKEGDSRSGYTPVFIPVENPSLFNNYLPKKDVFQLVSNIYENHTESWLRIETKNRVFYSSKDKNIFNSYQWLEMNNINEQAARDILLMYLKILSKYHKKHTIIVDRP